MGTAHVIDFYCIACLFIAAKFLNITFMNSICSSGSVIRSNIGDIGGGVLCRAQPAKFRFALCDCGAGRGAKGFWAERSPRVVELVLVFNMINPFL